MSVPAITIMLQKVKVRSDLPDSTVFYFKKVKGFPKTMSEGTLGDFDPRVGTDKTLNAFRKKVVGDFISPKL